MLPVTVGWGWNNKQDQTSAVTDNGDTGATTAGDSTTTSLYNMLEQTGGISDITNLSRVRLLAGKTSRDPSFWRGIAGMFWTPWNKRKSNQWCSMKNGAVAKQGR
jgi:hypothetical protein